MSSHRLVLTKQYDLIIVLKNGKIIETGNHDVLLLKNSEYANLWNSNGKVSVYIFGATANFFFNAPS
jgi:ABC-type multidrug transport system fused ATPase/permease subunit